MGRQATTIAELELVEGLYHQGFRNEALDAEFEKRLNAPTKPFYVHNVEKQLRFYRWLYNERFQAQGGRLRKDAPPFNTWLTQDEKQFIYGRD